MYPSDYGYATNFAKCTDYLNYYDSSTNSYGCRSNDWIFNSSVQWLLTPYLDPFCVACVWGVSSSGYGAHSSAHYGYGVRPSLFLSSEQIVEAGEGSSGSPYKLGA